ncbi:hypothetical protein CEP54_009443 [Fusarium duplospermum]|uniref:BZIP domain-containing protein n=1 Tax=Fusarium duplospermum TaxID=1325734 RepID=A0A428PQV4_9HYPO|nr:hypothetical protein CEP54_009443 [Fusarium duplospermum]
MPRKNKTAASVAENREAQRRSRARRQERIADLQRQLEEYQRMGVAASMDMQRVAQAVNVQNKRLKSLLGVYGISEDEIERYLPSPEEDHMAARHECITCGRFLPETTQTRAMSMDPSQSSSVLPNPNLPTSAEPPIGSPLIPQGVFVLSAEEHAFRHEMYAANGLDNTTGDSPSPPTDALSPSSCFFDSSKPIIRHPNHSEQLETSCDKAAKILVELHNHADPSWARYALGCHGDGSCSVKNTKIFQLMDHLD